MLSLYCAVLGFTGKYEEYNPNQNTEWQVTEKFDITKSCLPIESNQLECSDYSHLFSMSTDNDEQHFN